MIPVLGPDATLALYRALLLDTIAGAVDGAGSRRIVEISFDAPWVPDAEIRKVGRGAVVSSQARGDLGARMCRAIARSARGGAEATVILGADAPILAPSAVEDAFARLHGGADLVVGPAEDGGYVLVGARRALEAPFRDVPWGGADVLATTRRRALDAGLVLAEVEGGRDVDDVDDLSWLHRALRHPATRRRAPRTAAWIDRWCAERAGDRR